MPPSFHVCGFYCNVIPLDDNGLALKQTVCSEVIGAIHPSTQNNKTKTLNQHRSTDVELRKHMPQAQESNT